MVFWNFLTVNYMEQPNVQKYVDGPIKEETNYFDFKIV